MVEELKEIFSDFHGKENELIPILQRVQTKFGYLPREAMTEISKFTRVPESRVYSVATFYAQFRFTPIGKYHVMLCRGTACHVRGAERIQEEVEKQLGIKEGETTPDMMFSMETVACIGACGVAPNMVINKETYSRLTQRKISDIFNDIRSGCLDEAHG